MLLGARTPVHNLIKATRITNLTRRRFNLAPFSWGDRAIVGAPPYSFVTMGLNGDAHGPEIGEYRVRRENQPMTFQSASLEMAGTGLMETNSSTGSSQDAGPLGSLTMPITAATETMPGTGRAVSTALWQ